MFVKFAVLMPVAEANGEAPCSEVERLLSQLLVTQASLFYENGARGEFLTSDGLSH